MSNQTVVREAIASDIETVVGFQLAMAFETESINLDAARAYGGVAAVFEQSHRGRYFVAEVASRVVASLLVQKEWSDWRCGEVWWIHSVYVVPDCRRLGIFSTLYNHIKSLGLQEAQFRGLRLFVEKTNERAMAVYRSLGMSDNHYALFEWLLDEF